MGSSCNARVHGQKLRLHNPQATRPKPQTSAPAGDIFTMPIATLNQNVAQALALIEQAKALLPGLLLLSSDERRHTNGHYRDGEAEALQPLTDLAKKKPALFESLADEDAGSDPTKFEPDLIGDRLARVLALTPIVEATEALSQLASDSNLHLGEQTRPVLLSMYDIAKPPARRDASVMTFVAPAMTFYAKTARLAAETRAQNKKKGPAPAT